MNDNFVTDDTQTSELERAINELLELEHHGEDTDDTEPSVEGGDELQGIFGAQS